MSESLDHGHGANRRIVAVLSIAGTFIGVLLIVFSQFHPDPFWANVMFGLGLALAPSGVLGLVGDYLVFGRTMESLHESNQSLEEQVQALRVSTEFLKQSSELGLEMVYPNRQEALQDFAPYMLEQSEITGRKGQLIIVGSSIQGLRQFVKDIGDILSMAVDNEACKLRILLTHPVYSRYRESQEKRSEGAIEEEVYNSLRMMEFHWQQASEVSRRKKPRNEIIKLYKGTPTCFMIVAGERMLINPYPYEKEAYRNVCFVVRKVDPTSHESEVEKSIYEQYFENHYHIPWNRNALPYRYYKLEGPIPDVNLPQKRSYGDVFVVQDSADFELAIHLTGDQNEQVGGIPTAIPYLQEKGETPTKLTLGDKFWVRLLKVSVDADEVEWYDVLDDKGERAYVRLKEDSRTGQFTGRVRGRFLSEYDMIGLFEDGQDNPFYHATFARKALRKYPLPMFYYWIKKEDKPNIPTIPADIHTAGNRTPDAMAEDRKEKVLITASSAQD